MRVAIAEKSCWPSVVGVRADERAAERLHDVAEVQRHGRVLRVRRIQDVGVLQALRVGPLGRHRRLHVVAGEVREHVVAADHRQRGRRRARRDGRDARLVDDARGGEGGVGVARQHDHRHALVDELLHDDGGLRGVRAHVLLDELDGDLAADAAAVVDLVDGDVDPFDHGAVVGGEPARAGRGHADAQGLGDGGLGGEQRARREGGGDAEGERGACVHVSSVSEGRGGSVLVFGAAGTAGRPAVACAAARLPR